MNFDDKFTTFCITHNYGQGVTGKAVEPAWRERNKLDFKL